MPASHEEVSCRATKTMPLNTKTPVMTIKITVPITAPCWNRPALPHEAIAATRAKTAVLQSSEASAAVNNRMRARTRATRCRRGEDDRIDEDFGGMAI